MTGSSVLHYFWSLLKLMSIELVMLSITSSAATLSFCFNFSQLQGLFHMYVTIVLNSFLRPGHRLGNDHEQLLSLTTLGVRVNYVLFLLSQQKEKKSQFIKLCQRCVYPVYPHFSQVSIIYRLMMGPLVLSY